MSSLWWSMGNHYFGILHVSSFLSSSWPDLQSRAASSKTSAFAEFDIVYVFITVVLKYLMRNGGCSYEELSKRIHDSNNIRSSQIVVIMEATGLLVGNMGGKLVIAMDV
jgi:hypothetical protein